MKKKFGVIILMVVLFLSSTHTNATTYIEDADWTEGHHEIYADDSYNEIWMYNDCTLDIMGGEICRLATYDTTVTNWYDGSIDTLWARENSVVNIYGGQLAGEGLFASGSSMINLYAYDVILDEDTYMLTGYYYYNDEYFTMDVQGPDVFSHVKVVPEPITIMLLTIGGLLLRRKKA